MPKIVEPLCAGEIYGRWTVLESSKGKASVKCFCGTVRTIPAFDVRHGKSKSCGCLRKECPNRTTHDLSKTPEYVIWGHIKSRCYKPANKNYGRYGGRGITMCERWLDSFENFFTDMGPRPSAKHSIDRIDNNGNYEPGNCRWATQKEQARNKESNVMLEWAGMTLSLVEWCEKAGVSYRMVRDRLSKLNWPWPQALYTPKGQHFSS